MAANLNDEYEKKIDSLLAMFESNLSSDDEEPFDLLNNEISLNKSMEGATNLSDRDLWQELEAEIKMSKEHYLTIVREKSVVIEEKNRKADPKKSEVRNDNGPLKKQLGEAKEQNKKLIKERDQLKEEQVEVRKRFNKELNEIKALLNEQVELVKEKDGEIEYAIEVKNQLIEEKNQMLEEMRDKNKSLKRELEQKIEETDEFIKVLSWEVQDKEKRLKRQSEEANEMKSVLKKITEERNKLLREKVEDQKRFEKELTEANEKLDKQVKSVQGKDYQINNLKKNLEQMKRQKAGDKKECQQKVSAFSSTGYYPKTVLLNRNGDLGNDLGFEISQLPGGGVYLSSVNTDSPAAKAGLWIGEQVLEVGAFDLRRAIVALAVHVLKRAGPTVQMVVGAPIRIEMRPVCTFYSQFPIEEEDFDDFDYQLVQIYPVKSVPKPKNKKKSSRKKKGKKV